MSHKGTFENMVLRDSKLDLEFSYDVVNLDFTWVPFPDKESPLEGTWGAVKRLLEVQHENDPPAPERRNLSSLPLGEDRVEHVQDMVPQFTLGALIDRFGGISR